MGITYSIAGKELGIMADNEKDELIKRIMEATENRISGIEEFLGYQVTGDIIENLEGHLSDVYDQMPQEEIEYFEQKYGMHPSDAYFPEDDEDAEITVVMTLKTGMATELCKSLNNVNKIIHNPDISGAIDAVSAIDNISDVRFYETHRAEKQRPFIGHLNGHEASMFAALGKIIREIRGMGPSAEEWEKLEKANPNAIELWEEVANMDEALESMGY